MTSEIVVIFLSLLCAIHLTLCNRDFEFKNLKVERQLNFFHTNIWIEYSQLLKIDYDEFCVRKTNFIFPDLRVKQLYYRCYDGKREIYQCLQGFEFNDKRHQCVPTNLFLKEELQKDCIHQVDGLFPDPLTDCQKYFRCKSGLKVKESRCLAHQSFSFHLQTCQIKAEVTCAKLYCHYNNDGFFVLPGSHCQAYYYCNRGIRSDFLCPKGTIFNIQSETCVESGICYEPVCTGRIDGTYSDTTHSCNRSFTCRGGIVEEVSSCPVGKKYGNFSCIDAEFHTCDKPETTAAAFYYSKNDECKDLLDGTYVVPGTDCRNVRICSRGKTVGAFECPKNRRFNGHHCLLKEEISCEDECSMKANGYYADEFTDCRNFYFCLNGKISRKKQCPVGTAFNGQTCAPFDLVSCSKKSSSFVDQCVGLRDGFHPDYLNGCRNYFYCYNHEMVLTRACPENMRWNGKRCVDNQEFYCDGPLELKECLHLSPGLYQNKTSGCTKYYYCNSGNGTILLCPKAQVFNGYKCVNEDEYTCLKSHSCVDQPDGYRQDENTACRSYYYCSYGNKITYVCPGNLIFNGKHCVSPNTYTCPFTPSKDCIGKPDGYYPDKKSICKKYFFCLKGEKLNTLLCGGKKIFDGHSCILTEDSKSVCFTTVYGPCWNKKDGIYIDFKSDCRKYFTCKKKKVIHESWCPKGTIFNGNDCTSGYSCSKNLSFTCEGKVIGFFQDLITKCNKYFFCFGGTAIVGVCPFGTIFNGHICIDSNYYSCPGGET